MAGKEVAIKAAQMFTTTGVASRVSVVKEMAIGLSLGLGMGFLWQVGAEGDRRTLLIYQFWGKSSAALSMLALTLLLPAIASQTYHWNENKKWEDL
jgi:hypothetical protein